MKINRRDISFVLESFKFFDIDANLQETLVDKIYNAYDYSKTLFKMPDKLILIFGETVKYNLDKKTAKKIVYEISCQTQLSRFFEELQNCDKLNGKLLLNRKENLLFLRVHDDFVVKTDLADGKTYINGKFYNAFEEQDLLEIYCDFAENNCLYVIYKTRRLLSYLGLSARYIKTFKNKAKIPELKNEKSVYMIFTKTELIYKQPNS